ncbi:hypothetical protein FCV63_24590 [Vibrio lentus]|uniref:hypothetical protein n=1 Tax=Vibrio lentus TaxID=136468 RepID=UPI0010BE1C59|nr:hypothetical protein [Vibrio lentus]TKF50302.1 hypothetical protein FCV63_24590 [Vibrio lentus]
MFNSEMIQAFPDKYEKLFSDFEKVIINIEELASEKHVWNKSPNDHFELLNNQLNLVWACNVSKLNELYRTLVESINQQQYLIYGMVGRSIIEHVATMRYYMNDKVLNVVNNAVDTGNLNDVNELNQLLDKFLRGGRFDWESFFSGDFEKLKTAKGQDKAANELSQVNTLTCIQKWSKDEATVEILYDLFCDLVHPNIGSSMLVMHEWDDGIGFGGLCEKKTGQDIMLMTIAGIVFLSNNIANYLNSMLLLQVDSSQLEKLS